MNLKPMIRELCADILENGLTHINIVKTDGILQALLMVDITDELQDVQTLLMVLQTIEYNYSPKISFLIKELVLKAIRMSAKCNFVGVSHTSSDSDVEYENECATDKPAIEHAPPKKRWEHAKELFGDDAIFVSDDNIQYTADELVNSPINKVGIQYTSMDRDMVKEEVRKVFHDDGSYELEYLYKVQPDNLVDDNPLYNNFAQKVINDIK